MTTAPPDTAEALRRAKERAVDAWYLFAKQRGRLAVIPDWRVARTPEGEPLLTCEVVGPSAADTLHRFASEYMLVLGQPGDQRPTFDYSTPGRTACVWRSSGVWVELWHPDTVAHLPAAPVTHQPQRRGLLSRASDRLPYTRRTNTLKETTG